MTLDSTKELFNELNILSDEQSAVTLRALDKIDRLGWVEVKKILGKGREDKSGDFTKGADLNERQIKELEKKIKEIKPNTSDILEIIKIFEAYDFTNYQYDPSVIRGLEYYTGPIFEVNLNFDVKNSKGKPIQFGSIGGGGRYDNLVSNFGNLDCPATGISIGIDRWVYAIMQKKEFNIKSNKPVVICVFNKENIKDYIKILKSLREANISSEVYPGEGNLKKQMQYANKIGSPAVILYGENEIKSGKPTLRDLKTGKESNTGIENLPYEIKKIL
jgi:histidyl-tRNA synthetase